MDVAAKVNANPTVYSPVVLSRPTDVDDAEDDDSPEPIDELEVFEMIRHINDPEHPLTLEQLNVAAISLIRVDDAKNTVDLTFTPTIPHCSMATLIGLCIRVKLLRSLPTRFKVRVRVTPGTHITEDSINKQLADKERVAAALENGHLLEVVNTCISRTDHVADGTASARIAPGERRAPLLPQQL